MNNIEERYQYTSGDGTIKDVREMNPEYMINALAKANREFYNLENSAQDIVKYEKNIVALQEELAARRTKFLAEQTAKSEGEILNENN